MHTIVVGTESSERSQDAVALAALLARLTGAQLRLVNARGRIGEDPRDGVREDRSVDEGLRRMSQLPRARTMLA